VTIRLDGDTNGAGRTAASVVYVLFLLAPFTVGLTALGGLLVALKTRRDAADPPRAHLGHQVGLFWLGLLWAVPLVVLGLFGAIPILGLPFDFLKWVLGALVALWWLWRSATGLMRLSGGRFPKE
jgi:uncharacterized membrane protein